MSKPRSILHVDMDAFYASVECADNPSLRGKPLLVGGSKGRGVVSAASYEARAFGCRSAMPMGRAIALCPHAIVLPVRFQRYREVSRAVFAIFDRFTPLVEGLSVDEAFLDLTGTELLFGPAIGVAGRIKLAIQSETSCTASVGVSHNKFLAKLASDLDKPDGLTVYDADAVRGPMATLPVGKIWGIGPKAAARFASYGIHTIGDLRRSSPEFLANRFGADSSHLLDLAWGRDERAVVPDRDAKSIGQEQTFGENLDSKDAVRKELLAEVEEVAFRLRRARVKARTVTVKIRTGEFKTVTRSTTLRDETDITQELWHAASACFEEWANASFAPVRLIGAQAKGLVSSHAQAGLFEQPTARKATELDKAADKIRAKFGSNAIRRGGV